MNAAQLRIGNWVFHTAIKDGQKIPYQIKDGDITQQKCSFFEPIPFVEQWMKDFGLNVKYELPSGFKAIHAEFEGERNRRPGPRFSAMDFIKYRILANPILRDKYSI